MKHTILIADNDSKARTDLRQMLEPEGYDIVYGESGKHALELALARHIDAFLLAVELSKLNSIALCRKLRETEQYRNTPILFLTDRTADILLREALNVGVNDFIQKPFTPVFVQARVKTHLEYARVRNILKQYLSKPTLDAIDNTPSTGPMPQPEERDLAICFTDIRGFTAFSEGTGPLRLFSLVSELLADQVNIVHDYGGYVDKFGGDGVMAVFDGPDMVLQSCLCALNILDSVHEQNSLHADEIRRVGIGIHTGRAVVGNIGSPEHLDYSAIGSTVNLAARLCGQAGPTSIVVSKAVRDALAYDPRLSFHSERRVDIRGFKEPVTVYTLGRGDLKMTIDNRTLNIDKA
jgi:adenylate cyclase